MRGAGQLPRLAAASGSGPAALVLPPACGWIPSAESQEEQLCRVPVASSEAWTVSSSLSAFATFQRAPNPFLRRVACPHSRPRAAPETRGPTLSPLQIESPVKHRSF